MILLLDDPAVRAHLLAAVRRHVRQCVADGTPVPAGLTALARHLAASGGQARPGFVSGVDGAEDSGVDTLLTIPYAEAARRLSVSERSVRRLVADGELTAVPVGGRRLIRTVDLTDYVERLGRGEETTP